MKSISYTLTLDTDMTILFVKTSGGGWRRKFVGLLRRLAHRSRIFGRVPMAVRAHYQYYSYYPHGSKNPFSLGGRANEIFAVANVNAHPGNYTTHMGFGITGGYTLNHYEKRALNDHQAVLQLPNAASAGSPYIEVVWNGPGLPPGTTRLIFNQLNYDEMYFTDNHYAVYWKVYGAASTYIVFTDDDE